MSVLQESFIASCGMVIWSGESTLYISIENIYLLQSNILLYLLIFLHALTRDSNS